jgi:hypothetical protein
MSNGNKGGLEWLQQFESFTVVRTAFGGHHVIGSQSDAAAL